MSCNFKFKNKKFSNKEQRITLDAKHFEMVRNFKNKKKTLPSKKKNLKDLEKQLINLNKQNYDNISIKVKKQLDLKKEIENLKKEIEKIENNDEEDEYYNKNGDLIFQYFHNIDTIAKQEKIFDNDDHDDNNENDNYENDNDDENLYDNQIDDNDLDNNEIVDRKSNDNFSYNSSKNKKEKTEKQKNEKQNEKSNKNNITKFFNINSKSKIEKNNSENEITDNENSSYETKNINQKNNDTENNFKKDVSSNKISDYVSRKENFRRKEIYEKFMSKVDPHFTISQTKNEKYDLCCLCDNQMKFNQIEGYLYCETCGTTELVKTDCDKRNYKDPPPEMSYFAYKRINHFREWLAQFQAKETTDIPQSVYDTLLIEIKKNRINDMRKLVPKRVREFLKKHRLNKYYEHIPHIIYKLNGIKPPVITKEMEERLCNAFKDIQGPFQKVCPPDRKNFLSYSYVLYKLSQLLELDELTSGFSLLKSKEKLYNQDLVWKKICIELNWEYIETVF